METNNDYLDSTKPDRKMDKYFGKTIRKSWYFEKEPKFESIAQHTVETDCIKVTKVEMNDSKILSSRLNNTDPRYNFNFSSKCKCDDNMKKLMDDECVSKHVGYDRSNIIKTTTYKMPIIGEILTEDAGHDFVWRDGRCYDVNYIYTVKNYEKRILKQLCKEDIPKQIFTNPKIDLIRPNYCNFHANVVRHASAHGYDVTYRDYHVPRAVNQTIRNHIVGFPTKRIITHVEIFGEDIKVTGYDELFDTGKIPCRLLIAVEPEKTRYVTQFNLYYNDNPHSDKWTYGGVFNGISQPGKSNLVSLESIFNTTDGLYVKAIKIVPITWNEQPNLLVAYYGFCDDSKKTIEDSSCVTYSIEEMAHGTRKKTDCYAISDAGAGHYDSYGRKSRGRTRDDLIKFGKHD